MAKSFTVHSPQSGKLDGQKSVVWTFTNQKELSKSEFINYFERKIFRTIRKYQLLPKDKIFTLKKATDLNTIILKQILETKFQVEFSNSPNTSTTNLSSEAENIFKNIIKGKFNYSPIVSPLSNLTDKEIETYASLKNIKAPKRPQNKTIQNLFNKFLPKNQDLEINVLKAQSQLNEKNK